MQRKSDIVPLKGVRQPPVVEEAEGAESTSDLSLAKLYHAFRRKWYISVPLAGFAAVAVYFIALNRITPSYTARTLLHVASAQPVVLYELAGRSEFANNQRTQIATVKSRWVGQIALRDLQSQALPTLRAQEDPLSWLEKEILADYTIAPEILRISLKGSNPDEILLILAAVRDAYLREVLNVDYNDRVSRRKQLTDLLAKHDESLKSLRSKIAVQAEKYGARDITTLRVKYEHATNQINALQTELIYYQSAIQRAQVEAVGPSKVPVADPAVVEELLQQILSNDAIAEGTRKEIARLETVLADYERRYKDYETNPEYVANKAALTKASAALANRREMLRSTAGEQVREAARLQAARDAKALEAVTANIKKYIPQLEAEIGKRERTADVLSKGLADLERLGIELLQQDDQIKLVNSKIQAFDVELQAPPRARILEDAVIVETPRWDRTLKLTVGPAVAAFIAVLLLVSWLDMRKGKVNGVEDLKAENIRVIGSVPSVRLTTLSTFTIPHKTNARLDYHRLTDAVDMARVVIVPALQSARGYVLAVASALAGEGKTVLSGHLAVRFARTGLRTLLIDMDVRRPRIHEVFGIPLGPGFGEWITGQAGLASVTTLGPVPGLEIVPAGECDPRSVSDLFDQRLPELLATCKQAYDVVVVDSAPVLIAPESLVISQNANGSVLSVMRDVSRTSEVQASYQRLLSVRAPVLGAIFTGGSAAQSAGY